MKQRSAEVFGFEIDGERAKKIQGRTYQGHRENDVDQCDFMKIEPQRIADVVMMNPPFSNHRSEFHVYRAAKWLAKGGVLIAVMPPSWRHNRDKYATAFREWVEGLDHEWIELPSGSFKESNTMVNVGLLVIRRDVDKQGAIGISGETK